MKRLGGLDGRVAEGGRNLSSGERAACLLARAMLARAPVILLDGVAELLDDTMTTALMEWLARSEATIILTRRTVGPAPKGVRVLQMQDICHDLLQV